MNSVPELGQANCCWLCHVAHAHGAGVGGGGLGGCGFSRLLGQGFLVQTQALQTLATSVSAVIAARATYITPLAPLCLSSPACKMDVTALLPLSKGVTSGDCKMLRAGCREAIRDAQARREQRLQNIFHK